jgi:hypothetical protein
MKRLKFRIETSEEWTEERMLEELKKNTRGFNDNTEKQEAMVIISIRKLLNYIKNEQLS